ncbi:MAG: hypothetical protein H6Q89_4163, partial [Myxococcaceae bacterium]|nr:hypothetical protein [Myxococcaceae bacterium]
VARLEPSPEPQPLQAPARVPHPERPPLPPQERFPGQVLPTDVGVEVELKGLLAAEGQQLTVVVGQAGCGFWVQASGKATVVNGVARVTLSGLPSGSQSELMVSLDTDGDGKCSEADTVWSQVLIVPQAHSTLSLDLSAMESGPNWMCFAFATR